MSAGDSKEQGRLWRAAVHLRHLLNPTGRALGIPESSVGRSQPRLQLGFCSGREANTTNELEKLLLCVRDL